MNSKLSELVLDEQAFLENSLTEVLGPLMSFTKGDELFIKPPFNGLDSKHQILAALLAMKALTIVGSRESEAIGPTEINKVSGIPLGTAKRTLRDLETSKVIVSNGGEYRIPSYKINQVLSSLQNWIGE